MARGSFAGYLEDLRSGNETVAGEADEVFSELKRSVGVLRVQSFTGLADTLSYSVSSGRLPVAAGDVIEVTPLGASYEVCASDATSCDLDYTGSDGVKLNVRWKSGGVYSFGAQGNAANDTTAFQRALNAVDRQPGAGIGLVITHDMFSCDTLTIQDDTSLIGQGQPEIFLRTAGTALFTASAEESQITFDGLTLSGKGTNWNSSTQSTAERGINFPATVNGIYQTRLKDLHLNNFHVGAAFGKFNAETWITGTEFEGNSVAGILVTRPRDLLAIGNIVNGDRDGIGDGISTKVGLWTLPGDSADAGRDSILALNIVRDTYNEGIIARGRMMTLVGNSASQAATGAGVSCAIIVEGSEAAYDNGGAYYAITVANRAHTSEGGFAVRHDPANASISPRYGVMLGNMTFDITHLSGYELGQAGNTTNVVRDQLVVGNASFEAALYGVSGGNLSDSTLIANRLDDSGREGITIFGQVQEKVTLAANDVRRSGRSAISAQGLTNRAVKDWIVGNFIRDYGSDTGGTYYAITTPTLSQEQVVHGNVSDAEGRSHTGINVGGFGHFIGRNIVGGLKPSQPGRAVNIATSGDHWKPSTAYSVGNRCQNGRNIYIVTTAGTTGTSGGPVGKGSSVSDGTVVWDYDTTVTEYVETERHLVLTMGYGNTPTGDSAVYRPIGSRHTNLAPTAGGYIGSVCTTAGLVWTSLWTADTVVAVDDIVRNGSQVYICITAGTTASSGGPTGTTGTITDGTAQWNWLGPIATYKTYGAISA